MLLGMASVGIVGASGYAGAELLRLVALHPHLDLTFAAGEGRTGVERSEAEVTRRRARRCAEAPRRG